MKLYIIKEGTRGRVITRTPGNASTISNWITTRKLRYGDNELVIDPIRVFNNLNNPNDEDTTVCSFGLAMEGYSVFTPAGTDGKYSLAVKYEDVEVVC